MNKSHIDLDTMSLSILNFCEQISYLIIVRRFNLIPVMEVKSEFGAWQLQICDEYW